MAGADALIDQAGSGVTLGRLAERTGFHLRMAQGAFYRDFSTRLAPLDLTQRQCGVLEIIVANPGISQVTVAGVLGMDRATMMAMTDRLQARGLLERRRSTADRRKQELYLTEDGERLLKAAEILIAVNEAHFASLFTPEEREVLIDLLSRITVAKPPHV